jgi:hypothetical protein
MGDYPQVDPIPLPAPVWLFKCLHLFTTTLHFTAVHLLLGGLLLGLVWALAARLGKGEGPRPQAAWAVARPLPVVMTYVINLGVPPLLFTQVLYGRCLYTSSILIGAYWIAVIGLVMAAYFLLYYTERQAGRERMAPWAAGVALLCALMVAFIYVSNMTLMLRPETWRAMYEADPSGVQLNCKDPTVFPRWVFMIVSALATTGIGLAILGRKKPEPLSRYLTVFGGRMALVGAAAAALAGWWVLRSQPAEVRDALLAGSLTRSTFAIWLAGLAVVALAGVAIASRPGAVGWPLPTVGALGAYTAIAGWVVFRDGIRDATLLGKSYDVWDRAVVTNWSIVILFLVLLVLGLALMAWMVWALAKGKKGAAESHA